MNPHRTHQRGFTLLEIMVVLVIVGVLVSVTTIAFKGPNRVDALEDEGRRLSALIDLALQEAILQSREFSLDIDTHGYQFSQLVINEDGERNFVPLEEDKMFRARELPDDIELSAIVEGADMQSLFFNAEKSARIYIFSSGELSPFDITLQLDDGPLMQLNGNMVGTLNLEGPMESGL